MIINRETTHEALHAIGAKTVRQISPTEFEVEPDVDVLLLDAAETSVNFNNLIAHVKAEAGRRIYAKFPEWKQANMTARGVELLKIRTDGATWTADQQSEVDYLESSWAWIKSVREFSDALEADITAGTITTTDEIDNAAWPV